jgi:cold shock CspA family protein
MEVPLEIAYRQVDSDPRLEELIRNKASKLERVCNHMTSVRVAIEQDQKHQRSGNPYRFRLTINVPPGHEIVVKRETSGGHEHKDLWAIVREAFEAARSKLSKINDQQQGKVKSHPEQQITAMVERVFPDEGFGFIRNLSGREVYFHRNSLLDGDFEKLTPGTGVAYTEVMGEKGPQASTVRITGRPGRNSELRE